MKKTRRWLTLLLVLALTLGLAVSAGAVDLSAGQNPDRETNDPYLTYLWLEHDNGWFVQDIDPNDEYAYNNFGWWDSRMAVGEERWLIFYLNHYENGTWLHEPVEVTAGSGLVLDKVTDLNESVQPGQPGDYMYRISATEDAWDKTITITGTYEGMSASLPILIQRDESGFYSAPTMNNANWLTEVRLDPMAEQNVFYFGLQSPHWDLDVDSVALREDQEYAEFISLDKVNDSMVKISIDPELLYTHPWGFGFGLNLVYTVTHTEGEDIQTEQWERGIGCGSYLDAETVGITINGCWYDFVLGTDRVIFYNEELDREEMRPAKDVLPKGVSFDVENSVLTLNNAQLEQLGVWNTYDIHNEFGDTGEDGHQFPEGLTIKLIGENSIINESDTAVRLEREVDATITGSGSLYVKSVNSKDNTYYDEWAGMDCHASYDAFVVNDGSNLTIGGSAEVTVEVAGEALTTHFDEDGYLGEENAFLTALRINEGDLTLTDSATLTTVLPEGARSNGPLVSEDEVIWDNWYPGGYRGVENFKSITVEDNATLNTTNLWINSGWENDEVTWVGSFTQTGGTVNITGTGSYGRNLYEDEEGNQTLVDHYHYEGINTERGNITVSGGVLNIDVRASEEEIASSAYGCALSTDFGCIDISGGKVNVTMNMGSAINAGGWYDENNPDHIPNGSLSMTGGTLTVNGEDSYMHELITVGNAGSASLTGGSIQDANCSLNLPGSVEFGGTDVTIDGGFIHIENDVSFTGGRIDLTDVEVSINSGTVTLDGAEITLNSEYTGDEEWSRAIFLFRDAEMVVKSGSLSVEAVNYTCGLELHGNYTQTGGTVTVAANRSSAEVYTYGVNSGVLLTVSGGELNASGVYGINQYFETGDPENPEEWPPVFDTKLTVSGTGVVNATGVMNGLMLQAPAELSGGSLNAVSTGRSWANEDGQTFTNGNGVVLISNGDDRVDVTLTISGGSHSFIGTSEGEGTVSTMGIHSAGCDVVFTDGTCHVAGGQTALLGYNESGDQIFFMSEDMVIPSAKNGLFLDVQDVGYNYEFEGEQYTEYQFWLEEDNEFDPSTDVITDENGNFVELHQDIATDVYITSGKCGDDATWEIVDGELIISGSGDMYDYAPLDPMNPVASDAPWACVQELVTKVTVGDEITAIGTCAFGYMENVTSIHYGDSVSQIPNVAAAACWNLSKYTVSAGNTAYKVVNGCAIADKATGTLLTVAPKASGTFTVPADIKVIGVAAFECCAVEKVVLNEGLEEIGIAAFAGCTGLKEINIPKSVTSVGDHAFNRCDNVVITVNHDTAGENYVLKEKLNYSPIHEYGKATCTAPATCTHCDATQGTALGHSYGAPVFVWNSDYSQCSAKQTCGNDASHVLNTPCTVTSETVPATVDQVGKTTYTAKVTLDGKAYSDVKSVILPMLEQDGYKKCLKDETCVLAQYTDSNTAAWYHDGIHYCIDEKLMNGTSATTFEPDADTSRAMLVTILYRLEGSPDVSAMTEPFDDVNSEQWFYAPVVWAYNKGVVNGTSATTFSPDDSITREQLATILYRYDGAKAEGTALEGFADADKVSDYAVEPMIWAVETGLITGIQEGGQMLLAPRPMTEKDPNGNASRAQIATILMRYLEK